ncbi:putative transcriptional regulatory protein [Wickerhamomyces ciferrii]|uniref:Transcriptional regulatory protein n=1 Tax=Wickerhamomyces ciferrii (strain ATCC 14091 / BCRC 22168 / CBS 111 / JCM 3599 / NBRC 0793 / NRRL Y-1031 F-60-10) TaxID=1206466 RepID=K0KBZ8_WICCF|nr:putative transcriptional regulatory protein [Wickerhamomyces ciferrii]CCH42595.1 putative transcriptional regulatory protein [Wickerhamomyces ciferrii]
MVLDNIENQKPIRSPINGKIDASPRRQRIISESTGLVKFNLSQKAQQREESIKNFQSLEQKAVNNENLSSPTTNNHKNGLKLTGSMISPKRSSLDPPFSPTKPARSNISPSKTNNLGMINENIMLELATKQREVLELKSNMELLKKQLSQSEKELWEIEKKCNRTNVSTLPPALTPSRRSSPTRSLINTHEPLSHQPQQQQQQFRQPSPGLRSKQSLSAIKASIESSFEATANQQSQNFASLKKKISIQQLTNNKSNLNFKTIQKDFQENWSKSINAFSNLTNDFIKDINQVSNSNSSSNHSSTSSNSNKNNHNESDEEDYESDVSDYGCADASDYQIAVK